MMYNVHFTLYECKQYAVNNIFFRYTLDNNINKLRRLIILSYIANSCITFMVYKPNVDHNKESQI